MSIEDELKAVWPFSDVETLNPDIAGIGVRIAWYLQTITLYVIACVKPEEVDDVAQAYVFLLYGLLPAAFVSAAQHALSYADMKVLYYMVAMICLLLFLLPDWTVTPEHQLNIIVERSIQSGTFIGGAFLVLLSIIDAWLRLKAGVSASSLCIAVVVGCFPSIMLLCLKIIRKFIQLQNVIFGALFALPMSRYRYVVEQDTGPFYGYRCIHMSYWQGEHSFHVPYESGYNLWVAKNLVMKTFLLFGFLTRVWELEANIIPSSLSSADSQWSFGQIQTLGAAAPSCIFLFVKLVGMALKSPSPFLLRMRRRELAAAIGEQQRARRPIDEALEVGLSGYARPAVTTRGKGRSGATVRRRCDAQTLDATPLPEEVDIVDWWGNNRDYYECY
ncbi:hypothetical protein NM688_g9043 [Phlebia brevispora]|uniref:Uncharacterized protein n=1 Tax=Phlebia brevispora TaxID=194682 RepID=A0ACC1RPD4_9APHY|nr:hypothetical protein NM688_g9043 [Phlebia brevispora]